MKINKNDESVPRLAASAKQAGVSSVFSQLYSVKILTGVDIYFNPHFERPMRLAPSPRKAIPTPIKAG
jgi:hypothetical protein